MILGGIDKAANSYDCNVVKEERTMSKGPTILKISGIVMIVQAVIGFALFVFSGLSVINMLNRMKHRTDEVVSRFSSFDSIFGFIMFGLILITSIVLLVCALKCLNTYNYYSVPGGNDKYLIPSKMVLVIGAITFLVCIAAIIIEGFNGMAILIMLCCSGWILALLNLIIVKKDRAEQAKEAPKKAWKY